MLLLRRRHHDLLPLHRRHNRPRHRAEHLPDHAEQRPPSGRGRNRSHRSRTDGSPQHHAARAAGRGAGSVQHVDRESVPLVHYDGSVGFLFSLLMEWRSVKGVDMLTGGMHDSE